MAKTTIVIELEAALLNALDAQVLERRFSSRNEAIEAALREWIRRSTRLAEQCAMLDPDEERTLAEEGLSPPSADWLD